MNNLKYTTNKTPDGEFHIIIDENNTAIASGFGDLEDLKERLPRELQSLKMEPLRDHLYGRQVDAYYNGDKQALDTIPRNQAGSDFQKRVWEVISSVPYGKTISYKELANKSGNPEAVRATGTICGLNRLILLIPCHRVLKSNGGLGGYLYGSRIKQSLLQREKAI